MTSRLWHPDGVRGVALLPDGRRALTGCLDGYVRLWDLTTGVEVRTLIKHRGRVWGVAVSPDGRLALSGGDDKVLWVSDINRGGEDRRFQGQDSMAWSAAISPDGRRVLSGGEDGIVRLGDWTRTESLQRLTGHSRGVYGVAFTSDSRHAVSGAFGQLISWDLVAKQRLRWTTLDPHEVAWPVLAPDGRRVSFCTHIKPTQGASRTEGFSASGISTVLTRRRCSTAGMDTSAWPSCRPVGSRRRTSTASSGSGSRPGRSPGRASSSRRSKGPTRWPSIPNELAKEVSPDWQFQVEIRALLEEAQLELSLPAPQVGRLGDRWDGTVLSQDLTSHRSLLCTTIHRWRRR